jgi:ElaB/YqjD/DUF883 family membrane-anchored ribosome-binding protein
MSATTTQNMRSQADGASDRLTKGVQDAADSANSAVHNASRRVAARASELGDRAGDVGRDLSRQVEEQPLATLAIAAGVGLVAGLLLSRR